MAYFPTEPVHVSPEIVDCGVRPSSVRFRHDPELWMNISKHQLQAGWRVGCGEGGATVNREARLVGNGRDFQPDATEFKSKS